MSWASNNYTPAKENYGIGIYRNHPDHFSVWSFVSISCELYIFICLDFDQVLVMCRISNLGAKIKGHGHMTKQTCHDKATDVYSLILWNCDLPNPLLLWPTKSTVIVFPTN